MVTEGVKHLRVDPCHEGLGELVETAVSKGNVPGVDLACQRGSAVKTTLANLLGACLFFSRLPYPHPPDRRG